MPAYSTDIDQTVAELFDTELVIANYESGLYFSVSASGTLVWQGLQLGMTDDDVVDWLASLCPDNGARIAQEVPAFIATLVTEGLAVEATRPPAVTRPTIPSGFAWQPPALERFDDLQELLLLDPVHDVGATGWPHRAGD